MVVDEIYGNKVTIVIVPHPACIYGTFECTRELCFAHFTYFQKFRTLLTLSFVPCLFSLRAIYGTDSTKNALHGSDSYSSAEREIHFFFPDSK